MPPKRPSVATQQPLPDLDLTSTTSAVPGSSSDALPTASSPVENASSTKRSRASRGRPRVEPRDETAADRRRTQIRLAQRAYRQRKEATIVSLRQRNTELQETADQMAKSFLAFADAAISSPTLAADPELARSLKLMTEEFLELARRTAEAGEDDDGAPSLAPTKTVNDSSSKVVHPSPLPQPPPPPPQQPSYPTQAEPGASFVKQSPGSAGFGAPSYSLAVNAPSPASNAALMFPTAQDSANAADANQQLSRLFASDTLALCGQLALDKTFSLSPYNFQESTFARRIQRAALESGMALLAKSDSQPSQHRRAFTLALRLASSSALQERFRAALTRSVNDPLRLDGLPQIVLGGAGQHNGRSRAAPRNKFLQPAFASAASVSIAAGGNGGQLTHNRGLSSPPASPGEMNHSEDPVEQPPVTLVVRPINAAAARLVPEGTRGPTSQFASSTFSMARFRGIYFLSAELDNFLAERGVVLEPGAVFANVEASAVAAVLRDAAVDDAGQDSDLSDDDDDLPVLSTDAEARSLLSTTHFDPPVFPEPASALNDVTLSNPTDASLDLVGSPQSPANFDDFDMDPGIIHSTRSEPLMDPPTPPAEVAAAAVNTQSDYVKVQSPSTHSDMSMDFSELPTIKTEDQGVVSFEHAFGNLPTVSSASVAADQCARDDMSRLKEFVLASPPDTPREGMRQAGAGAEPSFTTGRPEMVTIDVERFVARLSRRVVWLGAEPGWRKRDVGKVLRSVIVHA